MRLIDADALIAEAKEMMDENELMDGVPTIIEDYCDAQPTVDAVPVRHGKWIYHVDDLYPIESTQECSLCHNKQPLNMLMDEKYCPNCGARMDDDHA